MVKITLEIWRRISEDHVTMKIADEDSVNIDNEGWPWRSTDKFNGGVKIAGKLGLKEKKLEGEVTRPMVKKLKGEVTRPTVKKLKGEVTSLKVKKPNGEVTRLKVPDWINDKGH